MRLWIERAGDIPAGHEERIEWLFGWWQTLAREKPTCVTFFTSRTVPWPKFWFV